ncbi:MAG: hypothetical protein ACQEVA_21990 [Myxococcota bacterium]
MRKTIATLVALGFLLTSALAWAAVTVRYYNTDSQDYEWDATCSGSSKTVKFKGSTTSSTTIQGSGPCTVHTPNGDVELEGGDKIRIEDATIEIE